ncbi:prepilin-type N-terminal cleavage/methylation domain-containing protein [Acidovorax facilis]|uniref:prepilin-type N-terminal cleavage/methylation domain-containing protein n=1 Tax=Acidovorax TaxID=12916 RepID=UPI0008D307F3|nr:MULTISPECIES: prepilin-type N-terminal cleavage/methylation domain-containing protein [unclassified Acidovorax]OGA62638.1 MAG: general secretion pathway protein GspJ [Burkholderiales bacterium RIFCSPHIGHO2_01_FULL_64_960]OGB10208.1 MAG: general secretion pathway protein GspJ [Burkholderiales bacterium RIFCSPHIGHO2_12_FULL_65_48]OGB12453.1 MAG: general secretion pathway protein GspJ [Burkholderiales bacterium RIFCSPHIGHO2_02_FULL_64_19]OGB59416.1 MAG: general secretion pathway protein GspJ [B
MTHSFRKTSRGFTLLELLVALAVTSAVVALMFAGVGVIGRSEERNQRVIERSERMLVVSQWLGRKFDTLRLLSRRDENIFVNFFSGNAAGAIWVAPLPERGDAGGLYVFRMSPLRHADGRVDLSVEAVPYDGALMALDWGKALRETLLSDVRTLQWHYQDGLTGQWTQQWDSAKAQYPARIRVEIADARGDWPPLVFPLARAR